MNSFIFIANAIFLIHFNQTLLHLQQKIIEYLHNFRVIIQKNLQSFIRISRLYIEIEYINRGLAEAG